MNRSYKAIETLWDREKRRKERNERRERKCWGTELKGTDEARRALYCHRSEV